MLPDMVVSGNVTCAALQQAAASGEVDHDLWGRELTYISGKMPDKLLFQGAPEAAVNFHAAQCSQQLITLPFSGRSSALSGHGLYI